MELAEIEKNLFSRLYKSNYVERNLMSFFFSYQGYKYKLEEFKELKAMTNKTQIDELLFKSQFQRLMTSISNMRLVLMGCDKFIIRKTMEGIMKKRFYHDKHTKFIQELYGELNKEEKMLEELYNSNDDLQSLKEENKMLKDMILKLTE